MTHMYMFWFKNCQAITRSRVLFFRFKLTHIFFNHRLTTFGLLNLRHYNCNNVLYMSNVCMYVLCIATILLWYYWWTLSIFKCTKHTPNRHKYCLLKHSFLFIISLNRQVCLFYPSIHKLSAIFIVVGLYFFLEESCLFQFLLVYSDQLLRCAHKFSSLLTSPVFSRCYYTCY